MKVTKFGHCCLLIEDKRVKILTDPGIYSTGQNEVKNIDLVLITHEHADHLHIDSLKNIIANAGSKGLVIITNRGVAPLLDNAGIPHYQLLEHGQKIDFKGVVIEGYGEKHAEMYKTLTPVINTGYFISNKLFYPGDAFTHPKKSVDLLALPVAGPWMKLSEAIEYALEINPKTAFPVHEGILKNPGSTHKIPSEILPQHGSRFVILEEGKEHTF